MRRRFEEFVEEGHREGRRPEFSGGEDSRTAAKAVRAALGDGYRVTSGILGSDEYVKKGGQMDAAGTEAGLQDVAGPDLAPPKWQRGTPDASKLTVIRGLRVARGIIHAHSLHSHDACDGQPQINGKPNDPPALQVHHLDLVFLGGFYQEAILTPS